ncbi:S1 family peptidase [Streptomyces chattanoogensis]|uniref:S1 family peptidase n=1 Tax=Streptomyces chattanoogensis TaxID=66876 RepID=UPI0006B52182|nr:serine protease [Streptomyces chattanoogensis]
MAQTPRRRKRLRASVLACTTGLAGVCLAALPAHPAQAVIGGRPTSTAQAPWTVAVNLWRGTDAYPRSGQFCGGTLVTPTKVITAAHCVADEAPTDLGAVAGRTDLRRHTGAWRRVAKVWIHPRFGRHLENDIAVLTLDRPMPPGYTPLPVATGADGGLYRPGTRARVYGWGLLDDEGREANVLRSADLRVLPDRTCARLNPGDFDPRTHVCANNPVTGDHHSEGDSGGPLVAGGRLIGIVSWLSHDNAATPTPGVYTQVSAFSREIARQLRR